MLDYTLAKAVHCDDFVNNTSSVDVYSIVVPLAMTDYRPQQWPHVRDIILKSKNLGSVDKKEIIWLKYAASLCLLDIYKIDVLNRALNVNFLEASFRKGEKIGSYIHVAFS